MIENIQIGDTFVGQIDGLQYRVSDIKNEYGHRNGQRIPYQEVFYEVIGKELQLTFHLPITTFKRLKITKIQPTRDMWVSIYLIYSPSYNLFYSKRTSRNARSFVLPKFSTVDIRAYRQKKYFKFIINILDKSMLLCYNILVK